VNHPQRATRPHVQVLPDPSALAAEAATRFAQLADEAVAEGRRFAVALSGGSTPRAAYALLATSPWRDQVPWPKVHLFWGDERCVPPDDPQSNYRMAREALLDHIPIPESNVHRIRAERRPLEAAGAYEKELRRFFRSPSPQIPHFDLVFLGLGPDGHTASLFPNTAALNEADRLAVANHVPQQDAWRITLTFPVLNAASHVIFLVAGAGKAARVRDILGTATPTPRFPAQRVRPTQGTLTWLMDRAAAKLYAAHPG